MGERLIHLINMALNLFLYLSHEINYGGDETGAAGGGGSGVGEGEKLCFKL